MTYGITVERLPDAGAPQVGITVEGLDGPAVISVDVSWDGGESWHGVRGAQRVSVVGGGFFRDHVPPLNVEATYRLVVHQGTLLPSRRYEWSGPAHESASAEYTDGVLTRRNRITNPSFETGTAGLFADGGTPTIATTSYRFVSGNQSALVSFADAGTPSFRQIVPATAGQWLAAAVPVYRSTGSQYAALRLIPRDASGAWLTASSSWSARVRVGNAWSVLSHAAQMPTGTVDALVRVYLYDDAVGGPTVAGTSWFTDGWIASEAGNEAAALASVATYFDGSTPDVPAPTEATITVTSDTAWLQDPLNPRTAVPVHLSGPMGGGVLLASGSLASAVWRQEIDTALPMGASLPVSSIGQRVRAGQVPLRLLHDIAAEGGALRRLLLSSGQLVLRGAPTPLLDPVAHIVVGDAEQTAHGPTGQVSEWDLSVQQVRPQSLRIVVPWWTYDQVRDLWAGMTYDQVKAARPGDTYLDWLRDPTVP